MSNPSTLTLEPRLTQQTAPALVEALKEHLGAPLQVDASAVNHIGAPGFEALLAAALTWKSAAINFAVIMPSNAFIDGLGHIGLTGEDFGINEG